MKKAKLQNNLIEIIDFESGNDLLSQEKLSEYKNFIPSEPPSFNEESQMLEAYYIESSDSIFEKWKIKTNVYKIQNKINDLKNKLSSTDYIIIKAYEAKISLSDIPYSQDFIDKTIQERQALRNKINELEELIK